MLRPSLSALLLVLLAFAAPASAATLSITGNAFQLAGQPFDLWGIRVASASQSPALTAQLIANLDEYRAHGVNTVAVYYMGSLGAYSDPFSPDGLSIAAADQARMTAIIRACDDRGMVVIVGIFYQRSDPVHLKDWAAAQAAVRTVATTLKPFRNVIINIANEQNSQNYAMLPWSKVNDPAAIIELCREVKTVDPERLVGGGGYDDAKNELIGRGASVDVLLYDTENPDNDDVALQKRFAAAGINKPMVNVELFGGWTKQFQPPGVYPAEARQAHLRAVTAAAKTPGLYLCFHSSPWCQGTAEPRQGLRFNLGGPGTEEDPGIRWYFDFVKATRKGSPTKPVQTN